MSFLLIPQTDIYYPSNVSDIYMNRNVTDIYLNWNGIFFFENDIDFITHLVSVKIQTNSLLFIAYFVWFFQVYLDCSFFIFLSQPSLSTLVSKHTLSTLFDFILHYPRFPKGSLKLPNIVQRLHAVPRACKQFYKLAVPWVC